MIRKKMSEKREKNGKKGKNVLKNGDKILKTKITQKKYGFRVLRVVFDRS